MLKETEGEPVSAVENIVLGKFMGLEMDGDGVEELVEYHSPKLIAETPRPSEAAATHGS